MNSLVLLITLLNPVLVLIVSNRRILGYLISISTLCLFLCEFFVISTPGLGLGEITSEEQFYLLAFQSLLSLSLVAGFNKRDLIFLMTSQLALFAGIFSLPIILISVGFLGFLKKEFKVSYFLLPFCLIINSKLSIFLETYSTISKDILVFSNSIFIIVMGSILHLGFSKELRDKFFGLLIMSLIALNKDFISTLYIDITWLVVLFVLINAWNSFFKQKYKERMNSRLSFLYFLSLYSVIQNQMNIFYFVLILIGLVNLLRNIKIKEGKWTKLSLLLILLGVPTGLFTLNYLSIINYFITSGSVGVVLIFSWMIYQFSFIVDICDYIKNEFKEVDTNFNPALIFLVLILAVFSLPVEFTSENLPSFERFLPLKESTNKLFVLIQIIDFLLKVMIVSLLLSKDGAFNKIKNLRRFPIRANLKFSVNIPKVSRGLGPVFLPELNYQRNKINIVITFFFLLLLGIFLFSIGSNV